MSIMCPFFVEPCLEDRCAAFDQYIQERFKDSNTGEYYSISRLREMAKTITKEDMAKVITRIVENYNECTRLGRIIEQHTYEDHNIPNYLWD